MNIAVVGTGYVGLVSGVCFAEMGNQGHLRRHRQRQGGQLARRHADIYEPGLEVYFDARAAARSGSHFTTDLAEAVEPADVVFLALPTPPGARTAAADLQYVLGVADDIGKACWRRPRPGDWGYKVLVDKSTVPVGTADRVIAAVEKHGSEPGERLRRGEQPRIPCARASPWRTS